MVHLIHSLIILRNNAFGLVFELTTNAFPLVNGQEVSQFELYFFHKLRKIDVVLASSIKGS